MKILFIVPYVPNLVRIRSYSFIKFLAARGHSIHLATLWTGEQEKADLEEIRHYCQQVTALPLPRWRSLLNCLLAVPTNIPLQYVYCWQPTLAQQLESAINPASNGEKFDVIHIEHLRGAKYGQTILDHHNQGSGLPPIIWDSVDCISLLFRYTANENQDLFTRFITTFDLNRTAQYEAKLIRRYTRTIVTSPKDRDALIKLQPGAPEERLSVISQGVDLEYFTPQEILPRQSATLVMSGKMSYHANVAMAQTLVEEILPLVWARRPEVELVIVGKDPPPAVRDYGHDPRIHVTGTVPDIRPFLQKATISVAPLRYGVGVQNKVLEAMACGTPVVTTPQVLTSITAVPGESLMIGDTRQGFAQAIFTLLDDPERRANIGAAGRQYVADTHTWNAIVGRLEVVYQSAVEEQQADIPAHQA